MHFLYDYINNYKSLRQVLISNAAVTRGFSEVNINVEKINDNAHTEHVSYNGDKFCELRHCNGNFTFYEKSIQSKDSRSPAVYQIVERDVQTD